jgi:tetratricopeptide (TPR) repeat protein
MKSTQWYVKDIQAQVYGPFEESEVIEHIRTGFFLGQELVARVDEGKWLPITQQPIFFEAFVEGMNQELITNQEKKAEEFVNEATFVGLDKSSEIATPLWKTLKVEPPKVPPKPENSEEKKPESQPPLPPVKSSGGKYNLLFFAAVLTSFVILIFVLSPTAEPDRDRIRLKAVNFTPQTSSAVDEPALKAAIVHFRKHTIDDYLQSQNILTTTLDKNGKFLDAMGFLCMTYKELWPYAYQDSRDIETVYSVFRQASVLKANSASAGVCYAIYLLITGEYEKAQNYMEDALRREPSLLFFNQLIGDLLEQQKKYSTAIYYFQKVKELWPPPPWVKPVLQEARTQRKLKRYSEALNTYHAALKYYPGHPLALMEMGILEYEAFHQTDKAKNLILEALKAKGKIPSEVKAEAFFALAQISQQQGDKKSALSYANQAFALDTSNPSVKEFILNLGGRSALEGVQINSSNMLYLGTQYMKVGNYYAAQAEFRLAFEADPRNALAAYHAGQSLWEMNSSTEAIKMVEKAIQADPGLVSAYVTLADYYSFRHNYEGAAQILKNVRRRFPNSNEIYRGFANIEYKRGNKKAAIQYGQKALDIYSMDVGALQIITRSYLDLGDMTNASNFINRALEVDPHTPENHCLFAKVTAGSSGASAGIDYLNRKIEEAPEVIAYRKCLGEIFIDEKNWSAAQAVLENIISARKDDKISNINLAYVYRQEGHINSALERYLYAASLDPLDPTPLFQAGELYMEAGNYRSANAQFERVLKINKRYPRVYYNMGLSYLENKDYEKAIEMATQEKNINPNIAEPYLLAAEAYKKSGQYQNCASQYQKAIMRRPQGAEIYINMANCYRLSGALEAAIQMLDQASQRESGNGNIYKELGAVYHMQGLLPQAYSAYERYLQLSPNAGDRPDIERIMKELQ